MKMRKNSVLLISIYLLNSCSTLSDKISPAAVIEVSKTGLGAGTGSVFTIPAVGGFANVPSAGAKVSVAAGTLNSSLSVQANADLLDNEGQGITLTGDWSKPITVEFAIPAGVSDPENYKVALRLGNGYWITCRKPKINRSSNTVQVRIAPSIKAKSAAKARPMANTYSLAFAKTFYLKPDRATVKLGEKVKFTAYAREGFVPRELMGKIYDSQAEFEEGIRKLSDAVDEVESNDDDLVPLPDLDKPDNDELVPLTVIAKEYPFSNTKAGFTRTWVANSVGTISPSGNSGANYTAPKDEAVKGKTVKVIFKSVNDKTKRDAVAEATVRIEDGLTRYTGIIKYEHTRTFKNIDNTTTTEITKMFSTVTLKNSSTQKVFDSSDSKAKTYDIKTTIEAYSYISSDGSFTKKLVSTCSAEGIPAGYVSLTIDKEKQKYNLSGVISVEDSGCQVDIFCDGCFPKNNREKRSYWGFLADPNRIDIPFGDNLVDLKGKEIIDNVSGSFKQIRSKDDTAIISWNLVREK
jgi:hypothetical protein